MQLRFEANQEHQLRAVEAVAALLDGQPRVEASLAFAPDTGFAAVPNRLDLTDDALLENLRLVQQANGLPQDAALRCIESPIKTAEGPKSAQFPNFSVEMETGTGKTYVYLRTALTLFQRFGLRKSIIVVPSVAIREGVLKTLRITERHLRELFGNPPYRFHAYDSANVTQLRQFALSDGVEVMVMTIDSFNKASNVIRQNTDRLPGVELPLHLVQAARPVLILDEPQNLESELRVRSLSALDPLFALRFSATHRNPYNLVFRLTPYEAYRQGLVKRIEVAGIEGGADASRVLLRLDEIRWGKGPLTARIAVHKRMANGTVREQTVTVRSGDGLEAKAGRSEYAPFVVEEIDAGEGWVRFANGIQLRAGEVRGEDREAIFREQIRYTIEEHFRRQARVRGAGIKVLSLFFIDRVDNYAREDGIIRRLFVQEFDRVKARYPEWADVAAEEVQGAYFASHRKRSGEVVYEDSTSGEAEKDRLAYDLIMRDKEELLAFLGPADPEETRAKRRVAFIFSHSALREGWDNPNVFQICTLNQTASEVRKRQEIGRGVRLAVNQQGERVRDDAVNVLTVVANQSYERYVSGYQAEVAQEWGTASDAAPVRNARGPRGVARLQKQRVLSPEFQALWERIRPRTRYAVRIDSARLVNEVVAALDRAEIRTPQISIQRARVEATGDEFTTLRIAEGRRALEPGGPVRNVVALMAELLEHTTPPLRLTRRTLLEVFRRTGNRDAALRAPDEFAATAVRILRDKLADQLVDGIRYEPIGEEYRMQQWEMEVEAFEHYLLPTPKGVYDHVAVDTLARDPRDSVEGRFVDELERDDRVRLYAKLPRWFTVPTPLGSYNPDWALVMEERDEFGDPRDTLYLVTETKGTTRLEDLPPEQRRKVRCGARHFGSRQLGEPGALQGVEYRLASSIADLSWSRE